MALGDQPDLSKFERVENPPKPSAPPTANAGPGGFPLNSFMRSPGPPNISSPVDTLGFFYKPGAVKQSRNWPQPPNATPAIGASAASQAVTIVQQGQGTLLLTDNVKNADQTQLNLRAGTDITLTADAVGDVTISASGSGFAPNLAVGNTLVNWPQSDPASVILVDDFASGASPQATTTAGTVGQLGWNVAGTGLDIFSSGGAAPNLGQIKLTTNNGVSGSCLLTLVAPWNNLSSSATYGGFPLLAFTGWYASFVFQWPKFVDLASGTITRGTVNPFTKVSFYLGFANILTSASRRPAKFIGLRFDTDTTSPAISDTTYHYEVVQNPVAGSNVQGTTFDTTVAPDNNWHRLDIWSTALGKIQFALDGAHSTTLSPTVLDTQTITSGVIGVTNGEIILSYPSGHLAAQCPGTLATIAGITNAGGYTALNASWPVLDFWSPGSSSNAMALGPTTGTLSNVSITGTATVGIYNMFTPTIMFGNDSETSPPNKTLMVDYFMYISNPKLAADFSATADPTKARYFAAQT